MSAKTAATAWESLLRAQVHLMRQFEAAKDFAPLSSREYDVLYTLSTDGPMRLRALNEHVLLTQPSLSRMVERMDKAGLVSRCAAEDDGRGVLISLTEKGRELQRTIGRRHVRTITSLLDPALTEAEQIQLAELTSRLRAGQREENGDA